jgi:hypothetical protein
MQKRYKPFLFFMFSLFLFLPGTENQYKISGQVQYKSRGMKNITLAIVRQVNTPFKFKRITTDQDGNFSFFHPNGSFLIGINDNDDSDEFFCPEEFKTIHVNGEPVDDIIFPLEKFCNISGYIQALNISPIDGYVVISNEREKNIASIQPDGSFLANDVKAAKETALSIVIEGVNNRIDLGVIDLVEGQSITNFNRTIRISLVINTVIKKTGEPLKRALTRLFHKENGTFRLEDIIWSSEKGESRYGEFNFPPGEYYAFTEAPDIPLYSVTSFSLVPNEPKEVIIELEEQDREDLREAYPFLFSVLEKKKKEIEEQLLSVECLNSSICLHDNPSSLIYFGDMKSIPVLIKVLKAIYIAEPPMKTDDGQISTTCTHGHLINTIAFIAKENPGWDLQEIEAWWEKKKESLRD